MPHAEPSQKGPQNKLFWLLLFVVSIAIVVPLSLWVKSQDPGYHVETYRMQPAAFAAKVEQMVAAYTVAYVGEGKERKPVVHPPPGADVYLPARNYDWGPVLELEKGKTYRLHMSSLDIKHAIVIRSMRIQYRLKPGKVRLIAITPKVLGEHRIVCGEYCGPGHDIMVGALRVVDTPFSAASSTAQ